MKTRILQILLLASCLSAVAQTSYIPAIYPVQQTTPGTATIAQDGNKYTLSNNILNATFTLVDGALLFGGCPEMGLQAGTELFTIKLGSTGSIVKKACELTVDQVWTEHLQGRPTAVKGAEHYDGVALCARLLHGSSGIIEWRAVLRDGSHYLRTEMEIKPTEGKNLQFYEIVPLDYLVDTSVAGTPVSVGNTRGKVIASEHLFAGVETPTAYNSSSADGNNQEGWETVAQWTDAWQPSDWKALNGQQAPARLGELGFADAQLVQKTKKVTLSKAGRLTVEFLYQSGSHRMNLAGVDLLDSNGNTVSSDYHIGYTGNQREGNIYQIDVPYAGDFTLRYWGETATETITSSGKIDITLSCKSEEDGEDTHQMVNITGVWKRQTKLIDGENWKVSAVVGLMNPKQQRRSFLAYSERERAVPWRAYPVYISWYELNIDRNNAKDPTQNMNANQVIDVVKQWKTQFFDKYGIAPTAFVIDDGWDNYGTWAFHDGFPNEMRDIANAAREMGAGVGAWLGPVGGYGTSGNYRRAYWNQDGRGGMALSNPAYYQVFLDAAKNLVQNQGTQPGVEDNTYRFFKFDGISDDFSANGPDKDLPEDVANENAEAIIRLERYVREELKEDIFFNTTVGTWASPFWYHFTDATWRQENDYGTIGNNSIDRENWITYRDRLVYQNYVQNSPLCPINTLMTHGFILSSHGNVSKDMSYASVLREMRCAFACGSGMVELYCDYALMNSINGGKLWADLAECIQWQRRNADVLPDVHWMGGNPWNGSKANVYGWGAWNAGRCTLALRNGATAQQTYKTTLRQALEIPENVHGSITLSKAFQVQSALSGLQTETPIDIDSELTLRLSASSIYVFDGIFTDADAIPSVSAAVPATADYAIGGQRLSDKPLSGVYIHKGKKILHHQ